jgi:predicted Zn-dependent protease
MLGRAVSRRRALAAALALLLVVPAPPARAEDEAELGRRFMLEIRAQLPLIDDPALTDYVDGIGQRLVKGLGPQAFDYHFYVVPHPSLNAFAVPGGYIFVFTGLLARTGTDDELAGVLAHEIAHVHAHHAIRQQTQGQMWSYAALLGALLSAVNPVVGAGAMAAAQTAQLKYSREYEQEADFMGLRWATESGYDPHALGAFFKQLLAEQRINPAGVPAYMLSHPLTESRVGNVDTIINAQKLKTPAGRPKATSELAEVRAVSRAIAEPPEIVIADYKRQAEAKPDDAERQFLLGRVYQTIGQLDSSRTAFERARDLGLGERADRPLGTVYLGLKQPDKARDALQRHLAKHPGDGWAHLELGKALNETEPDAALVEFQRAARLDPELDEAHRLAGIALGRKGREGDGFYELALAARLRGELEQALSHFRRAEEKLPAGTAREREVKLAIEELLPIVRERDRERQERRREGRRGVLGAVEPAPAGVDPERGPPYRRLPNGRRGTDRPY